ncbi:MAG: class I SAM-dependent methyltransferase [Myxococcales bacterium]|nr:class I SAM-dependent methyltransferase [Myxococcota bacterium]MDW8283550.1 class I SAM-dependent methyltransferase [Myxococcales bacterium]
MHRFWDTFLYPILCTLRPQTIVEIGADRGDNTKCILQFCRDYGARCHIIDPLGVGNRAEIAELLAQHGTLHEQRSLEVLPSLPPADVYLIDGDHNWYTVYHELRTIAAAARQARRTYLPLLLLHDIFWPYGRRDLYYDPSSIPEAFRQPYARGGMLPGHAPLLPAGGLNPHLEHALQEGGPRNGVLTAVEDFLAEEQADWEWLTVPGIHGLGLLLPRQGLPAEVRSAIAHLFDLPDHVRRHVERLEADWNAAHTYACSLRVETERLTEQVCRLQGVEAALHAARQAAAEAQARVAEQQARIRELEHQLHWITSAHSYRALRRLQRLKDMVVPPGSGRERAVVAVLDVFWPT